MKISNRESRIANLVERGPLWLLTLTTFAIILLALPVVAQTSTTKVPNKVTVTLVRWPYT